MGYNFGHYIQHWLDFEKNPKNKVMRNVFILDQKEGNHIQFSYQKSSMSIGFVWMKTRNFFGQDSVHHPSNLSSIDSNNYLLGDNIRVLDWIIRRTNGEDIAEPSPVGLLPKKGSINLHGLVVDWEKLMSIPHDYWASDIEETLKWLDEQLGEDLPQDIRVQIEQQKQRLLQTK